MCINNYDQTMYRSWDTMREVWTDRRTDGRKWHIEVGAPTKNSKQLLLVISQITF